MTDESQHTCHDLCSHDQGCAACHHNEKGEEQPHDHGCHHQEIITALTRERDEYLSGWQRAKADYQNLKKETEKQRLQWIQFANEQFLLELFELVDFFQYAFSHEVPQEVKTTEWFEGISHIQDRLHQILEKSDVQSIETEEKMFDPTLHEAVEERESDKPSGTILSECSKGFLLHGKVLRPAKVIVAK